MPRIKPPSDVPPITPPKTPRSLDPDEIAIARIVDNVGVGGLLQIITCECWCRCRDVLNHPGSPASDSCFDSILAGKWVDLARRFESLRSDEAVLYVDREMVAGNNRGIS